MTLPMVKDNANFCGLIVIEGIPTRKASKKKRAERNSTAQKTFEIFE
jgi:hypothetical protein